MNAQAELFEQFVWELRRSFRDLATAADRELEGLGIQTGERALLEFLAREQAPISISDLARKYSVTRQHIHQSLRRLSRPEWVEELENPQDSRAVLLRLSQKGRTFWERVRKRDRAFFVRLAARFDVERVSASVDLLRELRSELRKAEASHDG